MQLTKNIVRNGIRASLIVGAFAFITGCASTAQRRPYLVRENLDNAARHLQNGDKDEAAALYQVVLVVEPTNAEARSGLDKTGSSEIDLLTPNMLGVNKSRRPRTSSIALRIVAYPLNRVLDVFDCVGFRLNLGFGVLGELHLTRAVQAMAGGCGGLDVPLACWRESRDWFTGFGTDVGMGLGPFSAEAESSTSIGTDGAKARTFSVAGVAHPTDHVYQYYRDYWAVGGRVFAAIVGVGVEIHPIEVVDALAGFFFVDFLNDDIGHTRGTKFNRADLDATEDLLNSLPASEMRAHMRGRTTEP